MEQLISRQRKVEEVIFSGYIALRKPKWNGENNIDWFSTNVLGCAIISSATRRN